MRVARARKRAKTHRQMSSLEQYAMEMAGVPLLMVSRGPPVSAAERGTVLFVHGLGASKEVHLTDLERIAGSGFLAIGIDAAGHGERSEDAAPPHRELRADRDAQLIQTVVATARELGPLVQMLEQAGLARRGSVGLCGVSMGGFVAYSAASSGHFGAVVSLLASPLWRSDVPEHPAKHLAQFFPCALLSQLAGRDHLVDPREAFEFHALLEPYYAESPGKLSLLGYPDSGHFMREADWELAMARTLEWFERHLLPPG